MLTYRERKKRLPRGGQTRVAEQFSVWVSTVTRVNRGELRWPEMEAALATMMSPKTTPVEAYGPVPPVYHRHAQRDRARRQRARGSRAK